MKLICLVNSVGLTISLCILCVLLLACVGMAAAMLIIDEKQRKEILQKDVYAHNSDIKTFDCEVCEQNSSEENVAEVDEIELNNEQEIIDDKEQESEADEE